MKSLYRALPATALCTLAILLSACNSSNSANTIPLATSNRPTVQFRNSALPRCTDCGTISAIEELKSPTRYRATISMENGTARTVDMAALNGLSAGSRVRVNGGNLRLIG